MPKNLTITRTFDASPERIWQAWTDPAELQKWWGPRGVTNPTCEFDAQPEGKIHIVMLAGNELGNLAGQEWPMTGTVKEVVPNERMVFTGNAIMNDKVILETLDTLTLENIEGKAKMTLHVEVTMETPEAAGPLEGMEAGWTQSIDKLGELLNGAGAIITRNSHSGLRQNLVLFCLDIDKEIKRIGAYR